MRRALSLLIVLAVCAMPVMSSAQAQAGKTLDIYYIDTEGGQATLFLSPTGQSLLVDAGNAGERDLNRILEVLKVAGVKQIDHFWLTHYHGDHYGSLIDISKQVPIKHLYDHGPSIEGDRPNIIKFQAALCGILQRHPADDREARRQACVHRYRHHGSDERQRSAENADREGAWGRKAESALCGAQAAR